MPTENRQRYTKGWKHRLGMSFSDRARARPTQHLRLNSFHYEKKKKKQQQYIPTENHTGRTPRLHTVMKSRTGRGFFTWRPWKKASASALVLAEWGRVKWAGLQLPNTLGLWGERKRKLAIVSRPSEKLSDFHAWCFQFWAFEGHFNFLIEKINKHYSWWPASSSHTHTIVTKGQSSSTL